MYYYEARYMAPPVFISRDPLFEKYPTFTPYAYCANNPVKFIDPDGRELVLIGTAELMQKAIGMMSARLDKKSKLSFSVDEKGKVICLGEARTDIEVYMKKIIDNADITVQLTVQESDIDKDGYGFYGGCFNGNEFKSEKKEQINCFQTVDLITAKENDLMVGEEWLGQTIWHEIAEAFEGGNNSLLTKKEAAKAFTDEYNFEYTQAHNAASKKFPAIRKPITVTETFGFLKRTKILKYEFE